MTTDTFDPNLANQQALAGDYDHSEWPPATTHLLGALGLTEEQLDALMRPINPKRVSNRSQGGASLSYVEAHDVKATLTRIFGFGGYSSEVIESEIVQIREVGTHPWHVQEKDDPKGKYKKGDAKTPQVIARATVRLSIHSLGCVYTETAVGHSQQWDIGEAVDMALKTAESDALKRCAIFLGSQFGLSLYNKDNQYAEVIGGIVEPTQAAMLKRIRERSWAQQRANAEQHIERALGAQQQPEAAAQ